MIALDTNVVVRLLVEDDVAQTAAAVRLVTRARDEGAKLLVTDVVLCEVVWVLRSAYKKSREQIAGWLDELTTSVEAEFDSADRVAAAIAAYRSGRGDLADYLIRENARGRGAAFVATFDRPLQEEAGFVAPDPRSWDEGTSIRETAPLYGRRERRRAPVAR